MIYAFFAGNLGGDAEVKNIGGADRLKMRIATNEKLKDGTIETQWVECIYNVISVQQYLTKGTKVLVQGKVTTSSYTGKDGQPHANITVWASRLEFLGGGKQDNQGEQHASPVPQNAIPVATVPPPAPADQPDLPF